MILLPSLPFNPSLFLGSSPWPPWPNYHDVFYLVYHDPFLPDLKRQENDNYVELKKEKNDYVVLEEENRVKMKLYGE